MIAARHLLPMSRWTEYLTEREARFRRQYPDWDDEPTIEFVYMNNRRVRQRSYHQVPTSGEVHVLPYYEPLVEEARAACAPPTPCTAIVRSQP